MGIDRRRFIEMTAGVIAATALPGCASVVMTRIAPAGGAVTLSLRDYPQLDRTGGYLRVQPEGFPTPIYVLAVDADDYVAVSPICTHLGCTVGIEGPWLVCPCHGSTYDRSGRVVRGPAERSLRQFPLTVTPEGELIIQIGEQS